MRSLYADDVPAFCACRWGLQAAEVRCLTGGASELYSEGRHKSERFHTEMLALSDVHLRTG